MAKALISRSTPGLTAAITIEPAGLELIERMAAEGQDMRSIARALGCSGKVLNDCRKRDPAVTDAFEAGHAVLADEITHHLLGAARKGNIVAAIFLSKTRLGWRETGPSQDGGAKVAVQINMPGAMSEAMYLEGQAEDE